MEPRTVDLWDCALGFMDAQALPTADELGVFDALATGPRTVPELAAVLGLPEDSAPRLLTALCALARARLPDSGRYANGSEAADLVLTAIFLAAVVERRDRTVLRMGWDSPAALAIYAAGVAVHFTPRGHAGQG
jgi:hypothetical protein